MQFEIGRLWWLPWVAFTIRTFQKCQTVSIPEKEEFFFEPANFFFRLSKHGTFPKFRAVKRGPRFFPGSFGFLPWFLRVSSLVSRSFFPAFFGKLWLSDDAGSFSFPAVIKCWLLANRVVD